MARLVKTVTDTILYANIATLFEDGTESVKKLKVGDIVNGLRYVSNQEVLSVTGKITNINYTVKRNASSATYIDNITLVSLIIDASTEYASNIVTVPAMEIVEDEGVVNVKRMKISADVEYLMTLTYTDGSVVNQSLSIGDTLTEAKFMTDPGKDDLEGTFTITGFIFDSTSAKAKINGIIVEDEDGDSYSVPSAKIISFVESANTTVDTYEDIVNVLNDPLVTKASITINKPIVFEEPISIPAGKKVTLNLDGAVITVPAVAEGEKSAYLFENAGDLTINGGDVSSRGMINTGKLTINGLKANCEDFVGGATLINEEGGQVIINDCEFTTSYVGAVTDSKGTACIRNHGDLTINKAHLASVNQRAYVIISDGSIDITGEEVILDGTHGGLAIDGGYASISGGKFSSQNFYGLYVSNDYLKADVHVTGGEFIGKTFSVYCGSDNNVSVDSVVYIEGGVYNHNIKDQNNVAPGAGCKVTGGKFAEPVTAEYIQEGYAITGEPIDGYYEVYKVLN